MLDNISAVFRIIKQLNYVLTKKQKRQSIIVFLSMLLMSCLELLGVSSVYPLLETVMEPEVISNKWYIAWIYILLPNISYKGIVLFLCLFIILIFIVKNALAILFIYIQNRYTTNYQKEASIMMLRMYMRRPYEFFVNTNSSIILRGVNHDIVAVQQILLSFFQAASDVLTIALLAIFLFSVDKMIAVFSLTLAAACFFLIIAMFKGKIKVAGKTAREASVARDQCLLQSIYGVKEISVLDRKEFFLEKFTKAAEESAQCQLINGTIGACPDRIIEGVCISGFIGIVVFRLMLFENVTSFIPILGSFAMGAFRILPAISKLSSRINTMVYNQFGLQSCYDNIREAKQRKENAMIDELDNSCIVSDGSGVQKGTFKELLIDKISWHYADSEFIVIKDLSLVIHKGESVAFIGSSGAGKSTLADIIMGLLKPQQGSVLVNGQDIYSIPHTWHKQVGYVPQSVYLIDDTIRANVAFGLPNELISEEKVWDALESAQFKEYVESLPDGLDTMVGERGVKFSGGQRQRISLARALYEDPDVLVLDEATSALDNETENAVMESIEALQGHKTLIIVAHRLTTIRNCDSIYEIIDGKAVKRAYCELV